MVTQLRSAPHSPSSAGSQHYRFAIAAVLVALGQAVAAPCVTPLVGSRSGTSPRQSAWILGQRDAPTRQKFQQ